MKQKLFFFLICLGVVTSCDDMFEDEHMSFSQTPYVGNQIKINGYYYQQTKVEDRVNVFFLYQNGISTHPLGGHSISEFEEEFSNGSYVNFLKNDKYSWGLFFVRNDTLRTEFLSSYGATNAYPVTDIWKILNDTTIHRVKVYKSSGEFIEARNDTFHFKAFSPKPDSTNRWIP